MRNTSSIGRQLLISIIGLLIFSLPALAQSGRHQPEADKSNPDNPLLEVKTSEVLLPVTVRNQFGKLAANLSQNDFIIIEDGVRQEISSFNVRREQPLNVILLLDASGSIYGEMKGIRDAAIKFVEQLRSIDRVAVIQFADKVELIQDWTANTADVKHAINWRYRPGQSTHLWDAIFLAADEKLSKVDGRKAIIILTDGDDTESKLTYDQAYWATIKSGASVYVISKARAMVDKIKQEYGGVGGKIGGTKAQADQIISRLKSAEATMSEFAEKTGGRLYAPTRPEELGKAYLEVAEELKNQYLITYIPSNERRDGAFRNVKVALIQPGLAVNTKVGYVAPKD